MHACMHVSITYHAHDTKLRSPIIENFLIGDFVLEHLDGHFLPSVQPAEYL